METGNSCSVRQSVEKENEEISKADLEAQGKGKNPK
jgi:hypothetical protein